ncbi:MULTISPECIES: bifunctional (p)ppGpp synthetase/guanosine-3',5'-bis(diphosphate) 3'-pyrophosphohydrolase [Maritimibacter]|mgnify:CR=1 FL=1|jgi:GTP pyrophosphokinase/guanosine-3',5'-bis(diphosphate) 3'-pyrophosphohydrolase|uniref:GTP pyrophosphokinase rsh n=1 Tax=Maritimibacter alkaliphilus HTCC2654 TaxID=314271 RepID=A3VBA2_9RHOB|nr:MULTISPECIES: bifunctional (p)ppGpp synthetase/guanosine-3',5'-bis(diphosphate) 3'-pyrophosphohydrolase [Maritimibacter]EAQ14235.1 RelA/SpoT family protein [Rhodobacterales bacterium HTCC2654] [Maritimibacter alkaliphilus HTCC2654]MBL6427388.1 bifunctional (p)ppGpp synthetase/guanosine-3',5'-bis(diphosphate) 3'-pyrophosphohydrolase [Maritimibacter sp.]TYP82625.1 GTP pyrophosphokinase/guanosine-3',5'-bis(diphosphate) 3'-pyrophosphohydrolase [Maritimibacter alkaliphilus HTCC2654]
MTELNPEELVAQVRAYNPKSNSDLIRAAFDYGRRMHEGQYRHSGEPYFTHPIAVAHILAEQQLDDATIITALLHDTIEDTGSTYSEVSERFGPDVAELVDGVTKLTNLQLSSTETKQAENFRKLFMAMSKDLRVILVKLADRLHNMRTIRAMRIEKQVQKSRETMDIFAPLAGRMGMQWMREELEDLAFHVLNPDARASIIRRFVHLQKESGDVINKITKDIRKELDRVGIEAEVFGRAKKPYSIWRKMQEKDQSFSRLSDTYGFRVITDSEADCYAVLGAMHQRWRAVPGRFKDYISQPKSNGYRSIHTTVSGRDGKRVEIQIRTRQMHDVAEAGVAAHWSYKDGVRAENPFAVDPAKWIASLTERFENAEDHDEFLENVKLEMYQDQVFCFTPKGEVVKLPRGATPLDFAYAIHTRIGDSCVGARVDNIRVPLWTRIKNGQSVEIITAEGQSPQATWLDIVVTGRAKSAIRRRLREEDRERFIRLGRELARVAFDHVGRKATDKALATAAKQLSLGGPEDLLARLGSADLAARDVVAILYPNAVDTGSEIDAARAVIGLEPDQSFQIAQCCQPVPGERIVGITYRGKSMMVHSIDCRALEALDGDSSRWVDVHWHSGQHPAIHTVTLNVVIANGPGVLGRICTLIGEQKANISNMTFVDRKPDYYRLLIDVDLRDIEHLHAVMLVLEAETDVAEIRRHRDLSRAP